MKRIVASALFSLAVVPAYSFAVVQAVNCPGSHFVAAGGSEMRTTVIGFRNADLANSARVMRITIRNAFGQVVHDSGPGTGTPHPFNNAYSGPGQDVTTVPPGASYFLATNDIWGLFDVPGTAGPGQGFSMQITVVTAKEGNADLLVVGTRTRGQERIATSTGGFTRGVEHSSTQRACIPLASQ
jgi:hypothetical protein